MSVNRDDEDEYDKGLWDDEIEEELGREDSKENWDDDPFTDENYTSL
jgi:hypothetical protein